MAIIKNGIGLKILGIIGDTLTAGLRKTILETKELGIRNEAKLEALSEYITEMREDFRIIIQERR